ncbi:MAG TPA: hypothetical protein VK125_08035 [Bacillota bacterium]|nr:hypothetical protein [Bacillota bacterium]
MKKTYKQLNIKRGDPHVIAVATEQKQVSVKTAGHWFAVCLFLGFGAFLLFFSAYLGWVGINGLLTDERTGGNLFMYLFILIALVPPFAIGGFFFLAMGFYGLKDKPDWSIGLLKDYMIYRVYNEDESKYISGKFLLTSIHQVVILNTQYRNFVTVKTRAYDKMYHRVSVHIQYDDNGKNEYLHLVNPDGYESLDTIVSYLQREEGVSIYYSYAPREENNYESSEPKELVTCAERERITFNGQLKSYEGESQSKETSMIEGLASTRKHIKEKLSEKDD